MAFIFTSCIELIVKEPPAAVVAQFLRYDRLHKISPVSVAQRAMADYSDLAYYIFSMLSKNFADFFQAQIEKKCTAINSKKSFSKCSFENYGLCSDLGILQVY
jgi:hypothetical protein